VKTAEDKAGGTNGSESIVLFDGVCNLCSGTVDFILKRDRQQRFRFGALQSEPGRRLLAAYGLPPESLETFVLIEGGRCFTRSEAALRIARHLSGPWPLLNAFRILPRPFRDGVYNFVARHRYRWFGQRTTCRLPTPEEAGRFLQ